MLPPSPSNNLPPIPVTPGGLLLCWVWLLRCLLRCETGRGGGQSNITPTSPLPVPAPLSLPLKPPPLNPPPPVPPDSPMACPRSTMTGKSRVSFVWRGCSRGDSAGSGCWTLLDPGKLVARAWAWDKLQKMEMHPLGPVPTQPKHHGKSLPFLPTAGPLRGHCGPLRASLGR